MPFAPRLCIFDLDGTLLDSLHDIADAMNDCLGLLGLPVHAPPAYATMVGEGVVTLCRRALPAGRALLEGRLVELMRARYRVHPLAHTRPYAGIPAAIDALAAAGRTLAVLSNKPHELSVRIVRSLWPGGVFGQVRGYTEEALRKPDPRVVLEMCAQAGVAPGETCLVGDTPIDVETARRAGAEVLAVTWGFRSRAELVAAGATHIIDSPAELPRALGVNSESK